MHGRPNGAGGVWLAAYVMCAACNAGPRPQTGDWAITGSDPGSSRYSALDQINRDNVGRLEVAWTYRTGDAPPKGRSEIQATPIVVDGVLYTTTPALAVVALRADSGTLIWRFDPSANRARESHVNRGVAVWTDGATSASSSPPDDASTRSTRGQAVRYHRSAIRDGSTSQPVCAATSATPTSPQRVPA